MNTPSGNVSSSLLATQISLVHLIKHHDAAVLDKRMLATLALVCRGWAQIVQPVLFKTIMLKCYEDVQDLLKITEGPNNRLAGYVLHLECERSLTQPRLSLTEGSHISDTSKSSPHPRPWLYIVCTRLRRQLPSLESIHVRVVGPLPETRSLTELYQMPKQIPFFCIGIRSLELSSFSFAQFHHLVRQIRLMPSLEHIECRELSWGDHGSADYRVIPAGSVSQFRPGDSDSTMHYTMTGCAYNGAAVSLSAHIAPNRKRKLRPQDAMAFEHISSTMVQCIDKAKCPDLCVRASRGTDFIQFSAEVSHDRTRFLTPITKAHLALPDEPEEFSEGQQGQHASHLQIRAISLQFCLPSGELSVSEIIAGEYDWTGFSNAVADMKDVKLVVLVFGSDDELFAFRNKVVLPFMRSLEDSARLAYAIWCESDGTWIPRTPNAADILEDVSQMHKSSNLDELVLRLTSAI
ncbi:hypothetical protein NM688_g2118 [Phlebia brevispora]|uniref:Uncharacterized protein n=1 Tax=Phlebia brevispora TaxID=194682 RepID=A0ACC1T9K0_9APHY|nr:hypothetical protein NM688_g2118 [Phlebia brevispora]